MSPKKSKRLWSTVSTEPDGDGFGIFLDGRPVRTPARSPLILPSEALAKEIAAEWDVQTDHIDPNTMPLTRIANSAIDKVARQRAAVADNLAAYGDTDLLCYRADGPVELVARQNAAWDPVLEWAAVDLSARLLPRTGVVHSPQPEQAVKRLTQAVHEFSEFELAAFHDLVALTGSLLLAFATTRKLHDVDQIWTLSRIDEDWQTEQWGTDAEAASMETIKRNSFLDAEKFFRLSRKKA